jgi:hypothetical protein
MWKPANAGIRKHGSTGICKPANTEIQMRETRRGAVQGDGAGGDMQKYRNAGISKYGNLQSSK